MNTRVKSLCRIVFVFVCLSVLLAGCTPYKWGMKLLQRSSDESGQLIGTEHLTFCAITRGN